MVTDRGFIFHICIPRGKTFFFGVKVRYQGHNFSKKKKKKPLTLAMNFEWQLIECIPWGKSFSLSKSRSSVKVKV